MKAPQDCTGVNLKAEAKKAKKKKKAGKDGDEDEDSVTGNGSLRRTSTDSSQTPSIGTPVTPRSPAQRTTSVSAAVKPAASTRHIAAAPPPTKYVNKPIAPASNGTSQKAKVLYGYDATSAEELSVKPGDVLTLVEPDDGSGWILGRVGRDEGLVPATYVEIKSAEAAPKKGPPVAPRRGAKKAEERKRMFRAVYDYDANSELEISIREGDLLALVADDKGDGWTEVENKGRSGSVPSNYIEPVDK
jgi:formin-binding protein 1